MQDKKASARIEAKVAAYKEHKAKAAHEQQQLDTLAAEICEYLGEADQLLTRDGAGVLATYKERGGGATFDVKRFEQEHPKMFEKYQTAKKPYRVLSVK